jgi:tripartite-type tricarboxylate transporter receptor subunit TctC
MMRRRKLLMSLGALPVAALPTTSVHAANYPVKPIRLVVPFTPGGSTDTSARIIAERLSHIFGQQVIVENKAGGRTIIGTESVAKAAPDGYTVLYAPATFSTNLAFEDKLPYDTEKDFTPVVHTVDMPMLLSASMDAPFKTIAELLVYAKTVNKPIPYASVGTGSSVHLWGELIRLRTGIPLEHVAYKGSSDAIRDVMGGSVPLFSDVVVPGAAAVTAGKLRGLAIGTTERFRLLPDVPTMAEAGLPGLEATTPFGLVVARATPAEVVTRLNAAVNEVFQESAVRQRLLDLGFLPIGGTPAEYAAFLDSEVVRWRKVIKDGNIPSPA